MVVGGKECVPSSSLFILDAASAVARGGEEIKAYLDVVLGALTGHAPTLV